VTSFTTGRLDATRLRADDFATLCELHHDPEVMATLGGVRSDEATRDYLTRNLEHWAEHGFGLWMFRHHATGAFVGRGGLRHVILEGISEVEITYAIARSAWGQGYATEIATASIDIAFNTLGLVDVVAFATPENESSRRVMEKVGLRYERAITHDGVPCVLYRRRR
jgi:RimJ/RimL family protein N-acetyltransferase